MGRLFLVNLEGKSYSCKHCKTNLALCDYVVSKDDDDWMHTVADIYCVKCGSYVGWRNEFAFEKNQKYKEGKSVLERYNCTRFGIQMGTIIGWLKKLKL